jgi:hypothetical protein
MKEFKNAFNSMVNKFYQSGIDFKNLNVNINENSQDLTQEYIKYPNKDLFNI